MKKLIYFILFIPVYIQAQGVYNNGAQLVISTGAYLYIDGDASGNYLNTSSGSNHGYINNDGTIILEGDWTNNAAAGNVFTSLNGTGTVEFRGTTTQNVSGTAITIFEDVIANNTAGGTAISWNNNSQVSSTLTLTDGIITTGTNYLIHTATVATETSGGSSASFINGNYRRYIASNTSTYELPLGLGTTATDYHPSAFVNNALSGVTYLDTRVAAIAETGSNIDGNLNTTQDGTPIVDARAETAEWTITPNTTPSGGSYGIKLYLDNISGLTDNQFCVIKRPDASTSYADWNTFDGSTTIPAPGTAGRTVASNYALRTGYTTFSKFTIGTSNVPLPVEITSYDVTCNNNTAIVKWETASEINNDYFEISIGNSIDDMMSIAQIEGNGTSNELHQYSYEIENLNNESYIQLTQIDYNGKVNIIGTRHYSPCKDDIAPSVTSYTYGDNTVVNFNHVPSGNYQIVVYDAVGKKVMEDNVFVDISGNNQYNIDNTKFSTGVYFLNVLNDNQQYAFKFPVVK